MGSSCLQWSLAILLMWQGMVHAEPHRLNDYILDYQPLRFDPAHLHAKHSRVRRSLDPHLRWKFEAYGRKFNLKLEPVHSVFAPDHELVIDDKVISNPDTSFIYEGHVEDDPRSAVHMSIMDGSVSGHIRVSGETYHLEPARSHFADAMFPAIIYPESKMDLDPYRHLRQTSSNSSCGLQAQYDKLNKMAEPVLDQQSGQRKKRQATFSSHDKYSAWANERANNRHKRALETKQTCFMHIVADITLYNHILSKKGGDVAAAKEEVLSIFGTHVKALNNIYPKTGFKRKDVVNPTVYSGINFLLQRSTINTKCTSNCIDNLDVSNFLDLTSLSNHDDFCLVHTFAYRDFIGGILGLAWVATPTSGNAGFCGKFGPVRVNGVTVSKSLNTGITTMINFKQAVPSRVSELTFAHEVGHNFGSQHDITDQCAPFGTNLEGAEKGNYIMFPSANSGTLVHNSEFSACSKDYVAKVLDTVGAIRNDCFKESKTAFCGNNQVEGDEECDCGYEGDCDDACCNPQSDTAGAPQGCTRKSTAVCSPSQGLCCNQDCTFKNAGVQCAAATDCRQTSECLGGNATCPVPTFAQNSATFCNDFTKTCYDGECVASVCNFINWEECFLELEQTSVPKEMCYVSCRVPATSQTPSKCVSAFNTEEVKSYSELKWLVGNISQGRNETGNDGLKRPPGSSCKNFKGYCDVLSNCRNIDAEGPFKQLTNLIFNPVTFTKIGDWMEEHWWADLLICLGIVVFMGVFVKIFSYHTPSTDPKKKKRTNAGGQGRPADGRSRTAMDKF